MPQASILAFPTSQEPSDASASRLRRCGASALGLNELIGLVIGPQIAARFAAAGDRWHDFFTTDYRELRAMDINDDEAVAFLASIELARRFAKKKALANWDLGKPEPVAQYLILRYYRSDQEVVGALFLDARQRLIVDEVLYRGTLQRTSLEPRAFLRRALALHASAFILFHHHPSGDPSPSMDDLEFTRRLKDAADIVGIELSDHLILGAHGNWVSLARRGVF